MIAFVTVLLVSLMGRVQAEIGKPIVPSLPSLSPEIQVVVNKLAEIESAIEQGDINTAQATLQDMMVNGSLWTDWIAIYFSGLPADPYNLNNSGCQYIFFHYPHNYPPVIGINLPCMFFAPFVSWAQANGIYIYFYIF